MRVARLLLALALAGCESPVSPESVAVALRPVVLRTTAEIEAWPAGPVVESTREGIVVSGLVYVGCGEPAAAATRNGTFIRLALTGVNDDRPCPAVHWAIAPYQVVLGALPRGSYRLQITVAGREGPTEVLVVTGA